MNRLFPINLKNLEKEAAEVFIQLKKAFDFLSDGKRRVDIREDNQSAQNLAEKYAEKKRQKSRPGGSRWGEQPKKSKLSEPEKSEDTDFDRLIKLRLRWNPEISAFSRRHLQKTINAEKVYEEGDIRKG